MGDEVVKTKHVSVWLYESSEPFRHEAISTYTKGPLYCVHCINDTVFKYPMEHIFRIVEDYGSHTR